jgi:hypothetical protein
LDAIARRIAEKTLSAVFFRDLPKVVAHRGERQPVSDIAGVMAKKLI